MFKEKEYQKTEQEALNQEKEELNWQKIYGTKIGFYIQKINQLLAERTKESQTQIRVMFLDKGFFEHYKQVDVFAIMYIVMSIYELEEDAGIAQTILDEADTVEGLKDYVFQFKMILYRLDFDIGQGTEEELLLFLKEHVVSPIEFEVMLTTTAMRPLSLALKLEEIFEKHNLDNYLFFILDFINKNWKGNYRIVSKMADICRSAGRAEQALQYENNMPQIPDCFRGQEYMLLQVQQLLWKVMYKATDAEHEIALFMKNKNVSDDMWEFLIEHVNVSGKEHYLGIVKCLMDYNFVDKADITLRIALKIAPGDELILYLLAEIAVNRNEVERAEEYLSLIIEPGELTGKFQNLCKKLKEKNGNG